MTQRKAFETQSPTLSLYYNYYILTYIQANGEIKKLLVLRKKNVAIVIKWVIMVSKGYNMENHVTTTVGSKYPDGPRFLSGQGLSTRQYSPKLLQRCFLPLKTYAKLVSQKYSVTSKRSSL